jgi:hypothetical protein
MGRFATVIATVVLTSLGCGGVRAEDAPATQPAAKPVAGSFGICGSAESSGDHARLFPLLHDAGVTLVRSFPDWGSLEPQEGKWDFKWTDDLVQDARKNHIELWATFCYLAPWASAAPNSPDFGKRTRAFPIKDIQYWRDYVQGTVSRYHNDIRFWEVWNEFQGFNVNGTPKDYGQLVHEAYEVAKKIDPQCQIGLSSSCVDLSFLEQAIQQGAADHFDWIDVHPYELMGAAMEGREPAFLQIMTGLRKMLAQNHQRTDIPVFVGEIGTGVDERKPGDEQKQAEAVVKSYVLCLGQGIDRVCWFEGRGPYHMGLIRSDKEWTKRPSYVALQTMTGVLGTRPQRLGWLNPTGQSYGFVFQGATQPVLVIWAASAGGDTLKFTDPVTVTDLAGQATPVPAGQDLPLTRTPVFITSLPAKWVADATANHDQPFPWIKDYSKAETISCRLAAANVESGLALVGGGATLGLQADGSYARRADIAKKDYYLCFAADPSYVSVGDHDLEITVVAKQVNPAKNGGCKIFYESVKGYKTINEWWTVPSDSDWHEHVFKVSDANFGGSWGYNIRIDTISSPADLWIQQVIVKRIGAKH